MSLPPIPHAPLPDALKVPEGLKKGRTLWERMNSILDIAEPMLGVDRSKGNRANIHRQEGNMLFISPDAEATLYFRVRPPRHPRAGRPRYTWLPGPNGIQLGYYVPDAVREVEERKEEKAKVCP